MLLVPSSFPKLSSTVLFLLHQKDTCKHAHLPSSAMFHPSSVYFFPILSSLNILDIRQRLSPVSLPLTLSPIIKNTPPSNAMLLLLLSLSILAQPHVSSPPFWTLPLSSILQQLSPKIPLAILTSVLTERSNCLFHIQAKCVVFWLIKSSVNSLFWIFDKRKWA